MPVGGLEILQGLLGVAGEDHVRLEGDELLRIGGVGGAAALADGGQARQ
jgi:hypothetical protein